MSNDDPSVKIISIKVPPFMQEQIQNIVTKALESPTFKTANMFEDNERAIYQQTDRLGDIVVQHHLQAVSDSESMRQAGRQLVQAMPGRIKNQGTRDVRIQTLHGGTITITTPYFSRNCDNNKPNRGCYPVLMLLGIYGCRPRVTPALSNYIVMMVAAMGSMDEAKAWLAKQGIEWSVNGIRTLTYQYATRARYAQQQQAASLGESVAGRRIVVSVDGGRLRVRRNKRGPKTKKGRHRYHTNWREPKLLIIYVIDDEGNMDHTWTPIIDGLLKDHGRAPDAIFELIRYYLASLDIDQADRVMFVADGARWIWRRVAPLFSSLGLGDDQVIELVDFYHAVEHLAKVADLRRGWTKTQRRQWIRKQRKRLLKGQVDRVVQAVDELCTGRMSKKVRTERNYFHNNTTRMNYFQMQLEQLPLGSGAMESAIRRVVNLRLKGAGIFWYEDSANALLMLRSYYKAGRTQDIARLAFMPTIKEAA